MRVPREDRSSGGHLATSGLDRAQRTRGAQRSSRVSLLRESVDEAPDTLDQGEQVEVDQEPHDTVRELQVGQKLPLVELRQLTRGLELDDDLVLDEQVQSIAAIDQEPVVGHRLRVCAVARVTLPAQLV